LTPSPSKLRPSTDTYEIFASEKLFSVSAIFSSVHASSSSETKYAFTFLHKGKKQQAVLEKTFLTGLKKDNVRITWEKATAELKIGCIVRIDVTKLKSAPLHENWLVFGLYFFSFHTNVSNVNGALDVESIRKRDDGFSKRADETNVLGSRRKGHSVFSSINNGCMRENIGETLVDINNVKHDSIIEEMTLEKHNPTTLDLTKDCPNVSYVDYKGLIPNKGVEAMVNDAIDTDSSILYKSSMSTDFIDNEFDEVLKKNGVLKGSEIDDLSDAFETLYEEYFCQEKVEMFNEKNECCDLKWSPNPNDPEYIGKHDKLESGMLDTSDSSAVSPSLMPSLITTCGKDEVSFPPSPGKPSSVPALNDSGFCDFFPPGSALACDGDCKEELKEKRMVGVTEMGHVSKDTRWQFFKQLLGVSVQIFISELNSLF